MTAGKDRLSVIYGEEIKGRSDTHISPLEIKDTRLRSSRAKVGCNTNLLHYTCGALLLQVTSRLEVLIKAPEDKMALDDSVEWNV